MQKWVELFEKVIGRKSSPEEFMAGKACGWFETIQSIAEMPPHQKEVICWRQLKKWECRSTSYSSSSLTQLQHLEGKPMGANTSAEEFTAAKSQHEVL